MKTTLLLLLISLLSVFGHYSWCAPGSRTYSPFIGYKSSILNDFLADTTKKKKETVITSVIDNEKGGVTVKDAQIFDSGNQAGLINITIVVRDVETHAQLVKIQLKVKYLLFYYKKECKHFTKRVFLSLNFRTDEL